MFLFDISFANLKLFSSVQILYHLKQKYKTKQFVDYWVPPRNHKEMIFMTFPKLDENVVYDIELESIEKDTYIDMKCTSCGYEEQIPTWVYG